MSVIIKMERTGINNLDYDIDGEKSDILVLTKGSDDVVLKCLDVEKSPDLQSV